MEFLAMETFVPQQRRNYRRIQAFGFNPKDIVTIFEVKVPTAIVVNQSVQRWAKFFHFAFSFYRSFEYMDGHHRLTTVIKKWRLNVQGSQINIPLSTVMNLVIYKI